uniref:Protein cramped-like n=1 Tax=Naja naja TaxID=35670 RepID=A0A8C6XND8_NAJNA
MNNDSSIPSLCYSVGVCWADPYFFPPQGADNGGTSSGNSSGFPSSTPAGNSKSGSRNLSTSTGEKEEGKKVRRQWESWSTEDKNTFFEGLYEHGKDFEAIQNNIALKYKKKSKPASMVKNKEQVRHFYYRTWHKISKYIDFDNVFSQGLKKSSLELYGLICYGELRKKIGGCMDDKNAAKLNELIQAGATTVRYKGRNLRIKAPMCRALKKLCDPDGISDEEDQKPVRLPLKVPVELQPRNNHAWARVQSLAQNPRLRYFIKAGGGRWMRRTWSLEIGFTDCRDAESSSSSYSEEKTTLHLFPGENCTLAPLPEVARVVHSKAFCTVHWQESGRCKQSTKDAHLLPPAQILGIQSGQGTARGQVKYSRGAENKGGAKPETAVEASKAPQLILDPVANPDNGSPEAGLAEGGASSEPSVTSQLHKPPTGLQDLSGSLEKPIVVAESREAVPTAASPAEVDAGHAGCSCGDLPPDLEELSLLDPFPRYMKSCHDLIVPEKCLCAEKLDRKERAALPESSPEGVFPGGTETGSRSPTQPASGRADLPRVGHPSASETQACFPCSGLQAEPCAKELPDVVMEDSQEKLNTSLPPPPPPTPPPAQGQTVSKSLKDDPSRLAQQVQEKGWSLRTSESLTLAEVYLMMGKPNKLQLEYDWLAVLGQETQDGGEPVAEPRSAPPSATFHKQKLLNCLLKLISSEVNPKPVPEVNSVATSPIKPIQEEHALTPPGKVIAISTRSPGCARNQPALHKKTFSPSATPNSSGFRNPSKPLLVASCSSSSSNPDADGGLFAIPTTLPPNSRHGKLFLQNKEADLSFRQCLDTISMQSDFFLPKPRKLRSRHLRKPLVVQRTLLPRPSENPSQHVCSFSILSNSSITGRGSFRPIQSSLTKAAVSRPLFPKSFQLNAIDLAAKSAGIIPGSPLPLLGTACSRSSARCKSFRKRHVVDVTVVTIPICLLPQGTPVLSLPELPKTSLQNGLSSSPLPSSETSSTRLSPPNVSALLDISLPGPPEDVLSQGEPATQISDSIIEIAISSGQYGKGEREESSCPAAAELDRHHDPQWYPNDSTDSSLSSLFSSFLSPEKGRKMLPTSVGNPSSTSLLGPSLLDGNSRDSFVSRSMADVAEVVDSQLACMMNENSIDYISRFNDLAQELSIPETTRREILFDGGSGGPPIGDLSQ